MPIRYSVPFWGSANLRLKLSGNSMRFWKVNQLFKIVLNILSVHKYWIIARSPHHHSGRIPVMNNEYIHLLHFGPGRTITHQRQFYLNSEKEATLIFNFNFCDSSRQISQFPLIILLFSYMAVQSGQTSTAITWRPLQVQETFRGLGAVIITSCRAITTRAIGINWRPNYSS